MADVAAIEPRLRSCFRRDVLSGLAQAQKVIPSRWLYDERGSALFEEITRLEEYYPTRIEIGLLTKHADDLARFCEPGAAIVEYGAGSARKTEILLDALVSPRAYVGIDIAASFLEETTERLRRRYPDLCVRSVVADFMADVELPPDMAAFRHEARWSSRDCAVEMHLVSLRDQRVAVGTQVFAFADGETIHTESSRKYSIARLTETTHRAGWSVDQVWQDARHQYAIVGLQAE